MRARTILISLAVIAGLVTVAPSAQASVQPSSRVCAAPDGRVAASVLSAGVLYVGGAFTHVTDLQGKVQPRGHLAAIDTSTCDLLPWQANTDGNVLALKVVGTTLYAGGAFTTVGGQARTRLAALDTSTAVVLPFNPAIDKAVNALAVNGTTLYAGGAFARVNGVSRSKLAAFDIVSGSLLSTWSPSASGNVLTLLPSANGQQIYIGGSFTALNEDSAHPYLAAVDPATGGLDASFNASVDFPILSLAADAQGVYAGGGGHGGHLVIFNLDGSLQQPIYQTDGGVQALAVDGDSLYVGGHFQNYCVGNTGSGSPFVCTNPLPRKKLFEVSLSTGALTSWAPALNSPRGVFTESLDAATGDLWIGGDFTTINGKKQPHLGVFPSV